MSKEAWAAAIGNPDYEVSSCGRIKSLKKDGGKILAPVDIGDGHLYVTLCLDGIRRRVAIHTLVLEAFDKPRPEGMQACHANGVPGDNRIENLRWDTQSGNFRDRMKHGRFMPPGKIHVAAGEAHPMSKLTLADVWRIREAKKFGARTKDLLAIYNVSKHCINEIISKKSWVHA